MNPNDARVKTQRVVQTGLFIAMASVLIYFSRYTTVYIGGIKAMKISLAGPFVKMPALLFGPLYGGAAAGFADIIGYLMNPAGGYIPWITATAIADGLLTGYLWKKIKPVKVEKISLIFPIVFGAIGIIGIANHFAMAFLPDSSWVKYIETLQKKGPIVTTVLEIVGLIGLLYYFIGTRIKTRNQRIYENFMKLLVATGIGGILETTINTWILQAYFAPLAKMGFFIFWIPRLTEELVMIVIQSYLISLLLMVYDKIKSRGFM